MLSAGGFVGVGLLTSTVFLVSSTFPGCVSSFFSSLGCNPGLSSHSLPSGAPGSVQTHKGLVSAIFS